MWYENYAEPVHAWETTGHEAFESKFGLVPLVFGTLKATLYSMLFATPIAILAAIYSSQFMHPRWKARIKPLIEMMASLPSVVLGFMAGLVFAPLIEPWPMTLVAGVFMVPLALLLGAHLWQLLPSGWRNGLSGWRFAAIALVALPAGVIGCPRKPPRSWSAPLPGRLPGLARRPRRQRVRRLGARLLPLAGIAAALVAGADYPAVAPAAQPQLVAAGRRPPRRSPRSSWASVLAVALAVAAAMFLDALRLDTRGGLFGTYVQRNALVVAIGMSFAIIPLDLHDRRRRPRRACPTTCGARRSAPGPRPGRRPCGSSCRRLRAGCFRP